jgi:sortase A
VARARHVREGGQALKKLALLSYAALGIGVLLLAWAAVTVLWKEPFTSYQAQRAQAKLERELEFRPTVRSKSRPSARSAPEEAPVEYDVREGRAAGRISIPSLDVSAVFVEGTDEDELAKGPGHYPMTHWPGQGKVVAIAGHRTTYGAWFRDIDELDRGEHIALTMPYGRYDFEVVGTEIVDDSDWSILRGKGEFLVLSACHPLYSNSQRIVVTARPV